MSRKLIRLVASSRRNDSLRWWLFNISAIAVTLITRISTISIPEPARSYIWNYSWVLVYGFAIFKNLCLIRIVLVIWHGEHQQDQLRSAPPNPPELDEVR